MSRSVFFYQAALVGSAWYFTLNYGWLGYMLTMIFWSGFTFFRAQTFRLKILQTTVLFASGYIMWEPAYADLLKTAESAGVWLLAGSGVIAIVFLALVFRWLSGIVYANMGKRIGDAKSFLANPSLGVIKEAAKNSALSACGISDVLDTRDPVYLNVPYHEKEQAKALGARWNPKRQAWYVPPGFDTHTFGQWLPKGKEANVRSNGYFIASSTERCWKCREHTSVFCFVAPAGHETLECDGDRCWWERHGRPATIHYVTYLLPSVEGHIKTALHNYRIDFSKTANSHYWMNHCEHCGAKQGDFSMHHEPGGAFFPIESYAASGVVLRRFSEPFACNGASSTAYSEYLDEAMSTARF